MPSFEYNKANGMQYGNGGRGVWDDTTKGQVADTGTMKKQLVNDYMNRKVLIDVAKEQFFQPLATVTNLAPNNGKYIKQYVWRPLLDDRNVNDQGIDATGVAYTGGNLYGSSKDISTITGKLPVIHETGGRYNRVGFTRDVIEGTISDLGFFFEVTEDELQYDTMADLQEHFRGTALKGANEITEDCLQLDLINGAGVNYFCGNASSLATINATSELKYKDLIKLGKLLTDNHVSKSYKMFTGSTNVDTKVVAGGWTIYCGAEMRETFMAMVDLHGRPAFRPIEQYASGTDTVRGEIGRVYEFRIVEVPEMTHWTGKYSATPGQNVGASVNLEDETTYVTVPDDQAVAGGGKAKGNYSVFPLLIVGNESFTTIGFRTDGKSFKFKIYNKMPGEATMDRTDPYGRTGIWSIQWTYGTMILRPERLFCIRSVARI